MEKESQTELSLSDLISHIKDDAPTLMKEASRAAKAGNAQVLTALINLMTKYAENQATDRSLEVMRTVKEIRDSNLAKVRNGNKA